MGNCSGLEQAQTERRRLVFALQNPTSSTVEGWVARLTTATTAKSIVPGGLPGWNHSHPFFCHDLLHISRAVYSYMQMTLHSMYRRLALEPVISY